MGSGGVEVKGQVREEREILKGMWGGGSRRVGILVFTSFLYI